MSVPVSIYRLALVGSIAITLLAIALAWRHRDNRGGLALSVVLGSAGVWSATILCSTFWPGTGLAIAVGNLGYASVTVLVPSLLVFALEYTGRDRLVTRRTIAALAVEPIVFVTLVWTNNFHRLVWSSVRIDSESIDGIAREIGPMLQVHTLYAYALLATAIGLLVVFAVRSRYRYRRQVAAIVVATLVPWLANGAYHVFGLPVDPTPVGFTVTSIAFTWAVVREDFLDLTPVATEVVLETIDTAVFVVDANDRLVEYNGRAAELLEFEDADSVGTDVRSQLEDPAVVAAYDEMVGSRVPDAREFEAADRYIRLQSSPLIERHDDLIGQVFLVVDLTGQRDRERELHRRNEQLDRFASVVSHDLRSPLQVASASVALARETHDSEHFDRAERAHERMETLVENLLALARGTDSIQPEPVDVATTAEEAWSFVETDTATLEVDCSLTVQADPDRLQQLFENLFRNAVEHGSRTRGSDGRPDAGRANSSEPSVATTLEDAEDDTASSPASSGPREDSTEGETGESPLRVRLEDLPAGDGFSVSDDGAGFDLDSIEDVFEMGYTTESTGTGYGLSIVSNIVDQHGWSITATNAPDGGARIEIVTHGTTA